MMQMPQGPVPWVMQPPPGMVPGMQGGPWMQPQPMAMPPQPPMMPGAVPAQGTFVLGGLALLALYGALDQVMALQPLRSGELT